MYGKNDHKLEPDNEQIENELHSNQHELPPTDLEMQIIFSFMDTKRNTVKGLL